MGIKLNIEGMSCQHCVKHVTNALKDITGVINVEVSLDKNEAFVEHDGSVTFETMRDAVTEAGYEVSLA